MDGYIASISEGITPGEHADARRLTDVARHMLPKSQVERIAFAQQDRFIPTESTDRIHKRLERELNRPRVSRQPGVLIMGEPNSGKTRIVKEFALKHAPIERPDCENDLFSVVLIEIYNTRIQDFYDILIKALGSDFELNSIRPEKARKHLDKLLSAIRPKMIIIDEAHAMLTGNIPERAKFWAVLKNLINAYNITMVLAGTSEVLHAISYDAQLIERFIYRERIPAWKIDPDFAHFRNFVFAFEADLPLRKESRLWEDEEMLEYAMTKLGGLTGPTAMVLQDCAVEAIEDESEMITSDMFKRRIDSRGRRVQPAPPRTSK
jgi:hypothetical protein